MQGLALYDYIKIIVLLAGTVIVIRLISTSERKLYVAMNVLLYVALIGALLFIRSPAQGRRSSRSASPWRDARIWFALVLVSELLPAGDERSAR